MKALFSFLFLLPLLCTAQKVTTTFYDWNWKPCDVGLARFAAYVKKADSGWLRSDYFMSNNKLQMNGLYTDSACKIRNGYFNYFYYNGIPDGQGKYVNGKKEGTWLHWHPNGMMSDSATYKNGRVMGTRFEWHSNGYLSDSSVYSDDGAMVSVGWFSNGNVSYAGRYVNDTSKHGTWQYFHNNGAIASKEIYAAGKLISTSYFDENGNAITSPLYKNADAAFKGDANGWKKYLEQKLQFPNGYKLVNTDRVTIVISFRVDEEGNVNDVFVDVPFKKPFDDEALRVMKNSPKWIPSIKNNRKVPGYFRQSVEFVMVEE